eukprot:7619923-Alexandrium_andersonii.AAC.1
MSASLVGSEMCIRDRCAPWLYLLPNWSETTWALMVARKPLPRSAAFARRRSGWVCWVRH